MWITLAKDNRAAKSFRALPEVRKGRHLAFAGPVPQRH
jgi:hypothetical protein